MKQVINKICFFAVALVLGVMLQSCSGSVSDKLNEEGGYWVLKTFKGEPASSAFKGNIPSIEFNFDKNAVNGSAGCNRYFGGFTIDGDVLKAETLGSTNMFCFEENEEQAFLQIISSAGGVKISVEKSILKIEDKDEAVLEFEKGVDLE